MKLAVVNVGIGNIESVERALRFVGVNFHAAKSPADLVGSTHVLLPGVGAFRAGMAALASHGMVESLRELAATKEVRFLGICLGMQLMGEFSEEGNCEGLGLLPFTVAKLQANPELGVKVPHVGFSGVYGFERTSFFADLDDDSDFYFTHSYACLGGVPGANVAYTKHGDVFVSAFQAGNICGAQFHPEKSQSNGLIMLRNFCRS